MNVLSKSRLLKKPFAHVLPKVSKTLLPPFKAFSTIPHLYTNCLYREKSGSQLVLHCDRRQQLLLLLRRPRLYFVQYRVRLQQKKTTRSTYSAIYKAAGLTVPGSYMIWLVLFHHSTIPSLKPVMGEQCLRVVPATCIFYRSARNGQ